MAGVFTCRMQYLKNVICVPLIVSVLQLKSYTQTCKHLWNPWNSKRKEGTTSLKIM